MIENQSRNQIQQQEEIKRAFLRGVSALNTEAMGIFKKENYESVRYKDEHEHFPIPEAKREITIPRTGREPTKYSKDSQGISSTNGLVTRHYRQ